MSAWIQRYWPADKNAEKIVPFSRPKNLFKMIPVNPARSILPFYPWFFYRFAEDNKQTPQSVYTAILTQFQFVRQTQNFVVYIMFTPI